MAPKMKNSERIRHWRERAKKAETVVAAAEQWRAHMDEAMPYGYKWKTAVFDDILAGKGPDGQEQTK